MKKAACVPPLIMCVLLLLCQYPINAQSGEYSLAVLPFVGGPSGEEEAIARRLESELNRTRQFSVQAWNSISSIIEGEVNFRQKYKGLFDPDAIFEMGQRLEIRYVATGLISRLGTKNLVIIAILDINTLEQIAGAYRQYTNREEILDLLPAMALDLAVDTRSDTSNKQGLSIPRFEFRAGGAFQEDAETLAQILAVEIVKNRKYAVMPRTSNVDAVRTGRASNSNDGPGRGRTPDLVLSGEASSVGSRNSFDVQIIDYKSWRLIPGGEDNQVYITIEEGIPLMKRIAYNITGGAEQDRIRQAEEAAQQAEEQARLAKEREEEQVRLTKEREKKKRFWSIGVSAGTSFTVPWVIATFNATLSLFPYSFFDIGADVGLIHLYKRPDLSYISVYPFARFNSFIPFGAFGGWYAGAGGGYMMAFYGENGEDTSLQTPVFDLSTGFYFGANHRYFSISYSLRTPIDPPLKQFFAVLNHKVSIGFSYRF
ncbi:hypothetical protein FACS189483_09390 [Spirochaetia bacterium]|nr:hypothetical protein FACS189483_09390 [Spirochaetia bacterium]